MITPKQQQHQTTDSGLQKVRTSALVGQGLTAVGLVTHSNNLAEGVNHRDYGRALFIASLNN